MSRNAVAGALPAEGEFAEAKALKAKIGPKNSAAAGGRVLLAWRCVGTRAGSIRIQQECGGPGRGVRRQGRLAGFAVDGSRTEANRAGVAAFRRV